MDRKNWKALIIGLVAVVFSGLAITITTVTRYRLKNKQADAQNKPEPQ